MTRYWIGVASREHVLNGKAGGFCQLGHGKHSPVQRLSPGDGIAYYAPREVMGAGAPVQSFVSIGVVRPGDIYQREQRAGFSPFRRNVDWLDAKEAPIRPLLGALTFIPEGASWGMAFRRGAFEISRDDFLIIAEAMGVSASFRA